MFSIPEHLNELHLIEKNKFNSSFGEKVYLKKEASFCYSVENNFLKPLFKKSDKINEIAKKMLSLNSDKKLKKQFKQWYLNLFEIYNLNKYSKNDLNLELRETSHRSGKSYYSCHKRCIFIQKNDFKIGSNKKYCFDLLYVAMHELAHAIVDIKYNLGVIHSHDHIFMFVLLQLFEDLTGISKNKVLYKNPIKETSEYIYFHDFCNKNNFLNPTTSKHLAKVRDFEYLEKAKEFVKNKFNYTVSEKDFDWILKDNIYFEIEESEDDIFPSKRVFIFKMKGNYQVVLFKEKAYQEEKHQIYISNLQKKYDK